VFGNALEQNAHLLFLHIDGNKLGPEGGASIADALERKNATLQRLWIPQNELGEEGGRAFARALRSNRTLEHLGIANNSIGPEAGAEIADALKGNICLLTLRIGSNQLGVRGGRAFAEALSANHYLSTLELNNNNLQAEATTAIASSLRDKNKTLTRFDTENNAIGVEGLQALAGVLEVNRKLKLLSLQGNGIEPGTGDLFGRALGNNGVVTTIWLDGGELSGDAIGDMLQKNATLEVLGFAGSVSSAVIDSIRTALAESTVSQLQTVHFGSADGVKQVMADIEKLKEAAKGIGITVKIGW
jgi:Ran GTPase-activating protein (RanGAP) involved in mRNA processing and transport